jgi:hypothetical protein
VIITLAGPGRRAAGFVLDVLLFAVTLGAGWLAWSIWLWSSGRTPAKQILGMRVVDGISGEPVGWRRMALRQVVYAIGIAGLFGAATVGVGWAISAVFVLSPTRQALWDRLAFTTVARNGVPPSIPGSEAAADTVQLDPAPEEDTVMITPARVQEPSPTAAPTGTPIAAAPVETAIAAEPAGSPIAPEPTEAAIATEAAAAGAEKVRAAAKSASSEEAS